MKQAHVADIVGLISMGDAERAKATAGRLGRFSSLVFSAGGSVERRTVGRMMERKEAIPDA